MSLTKKDLKSIQQIVNSGILPLKVEVRKLGAEIMPLKVEVRKLGLEFEKFRHDFKIVAENIDQHHHRLDGHEGRIDRLEKRP